MLSNLFSRPNSIFVVCFLTRNFDIPSHEISHLIHVIFNGDNFSQWSQAMRSYLKGCKLWLYVFGDRPIQEQVDKETDYIYVIRIGKVLIIISSLSFVIHIFHPLLMSLATLILPKKFRT